MSPVSVTSTFPNEQTHDSGKKKLLETSEQPKRPFASTSQVVRETDKEETDRQKEREAKQTEREGSYSGGR